MPRIAPPDLVRRRFRRFLETGEWHAAYNELHLNRITTAYAAGLLVCKGRPFEIPGFIKDEVNFGIATKRLAARYEALAERGVPLRVGVIIQSTLLRQGHNIAPALVIADFNDPELSDKEWLLNTIVASSFPDPSKGNTKEERDYFKFAADERYRIGKRYRLPESIRGHREAWLFHLRVYAPFTDVANSDHVCLVDPEPGGLIMAIPPKIYAESNYQRP